MNDLPDEELNLKNVVKSMLYRNAMPIPKRLVPAVARFKSEART